MVKGDFVRVINQCSVLFNNVGLIISSENNKHLITFGGGRREFFSDFDLMLDSEYQKLVEPITRKKLLLG